MSPKITGKQMVVLELLAIKYQGVAPLETSCPEIANHLKGFGVESAPNARSRLNSLKYKGLIVSMPGRNQSTQKNVLHIRITEEGFNKLEEWRQKNEDIKSEIISYYKFYDHSGSLEISDTEINEIKHKAERYIQQEGWGNRKPSNPVINEYLRNNIPMFLKYLKFIRYINENKALRDHLDKHLCKEASSHFVSALADSEIRVLDHPEILENWVGLAEVYKILGSDYSSEWGNKKSRELSTHMRKYDKKMLEEFNQTLAAREKEEASLFANAVSYETVLGGRGLTSTKQGESQEGRGALALCQSSKTEVDNIAREIQEQAGASNDEFQEIIMLAVQDIKEETGKIYEEPTISMINVYLKNNLDRFLNILEFRKYVRENRVLNNDINFHEENKNYALQAAKEEVYKFPEELTTWGRLASLYEDLIYEDRNRKDEIEKMFRHLCNFDYNKTMADTFYNKFLKKYEMLGISGCRQSSISGFPSFDPKCI